MNEETNLQLPTNPPLVIPDVSNCSFSIVFNEDCVQGLKHFADKYFDLAIVDPPYGIGAENHAGNADNGWKQWDKKSWDNAIPDLLDSQLKVK
jgi:DNA modification methylase